MSDTINIEAAIAVLDEEIAAAKLRADDAYSSYKRVKDDADRLLTEWCRRGELVRTLEGVRAKLSPTPDAPILQAVA